MAGRIPPEFIDELISRVDIVDVIDERVPLKKAGKEFTACCPFHDEKTPSFTVSPSKQFFHCFGCGVHGTALGFLMDYEHMSFPEAVEDLASRVGLQVPREGGQAPRRDGPPLGDIYDVLERSDKFFRQQLRVHSQSPRAVDYLKERGLSGEIAAEFGIGYAPDGWDNLAKAFGNQSQANEMLIQAGMLIKKDSGGSYDRFRDRIMFPIRDARGRTIAFGGRILPGSGDEKGAKYLNSPETPVFHKGRELYGLYEARQALRKLERLLVVEGYMDVVALAQNGIRYAVATLGTATTTEHMNRLYRMVDEVVFCFDGDRAGREAGWRALENALPGMREGRHLRFMFLPDGEDPDSLVRAIGADAFEQQIAQSHTFSEYFLEVLRSGVDIETMEGRAALVEKAKPLLARMPDDALSTMLRKELAELCNLTPGQLGVGVTAQTPRPSRARPQQAGLGQREGVSPIRTIIRGLLNAPELALEVGPALRFEELSLPGLALMIEMVEMVQASPNITLAVLLEHWRGSEHEKALQKLVVEELLLDSEQLKTDFLGALQRLDQQRVAVRQEQLLEKSRFGELSQEDKQELNRLLTGQ